MHSAVDSRRLKLRRIAVRDSDVDSSVCRLNVQLIAPPGVPCELYFQAAVRSFTADVTANAIQRDTTILRIESHLTFDVGDGDAAVVRLQVETGTSRRQDFEADRPILIAHLAGTVCPDRAGRRLHLHLRGEVFRLLLAGSAGLDSGADQNVGPVRACDADATIGSGIDIQRASVGNRSFADFAKADSVTTSPVRTVGARRLSESSCADQEGRT
jgi:hypothetical protein